ncbi:hypothetical protein [Streptomyces sp. Da 82-17]|uniref:hypothetical protein n=1 Tax=Streptomyces sp. Da 82-17 TaxID=3377116 RepID=UPI0038D47AAA
MGLFRKTVEEKAAIAELRAADAALHQNQQREEAAGIDHETPQYQRLNTAANKAASKVSRWHGGTKRT